MIGVVRTFLRQPAENRAILWQASVLLLAARIILPVLHLTRVRSVLAAMARIVVRRWSGAAPGVERIVWAIETAGRRSGLLCLPKAIAAQTLLNRYGHKAELCIGAARLDGAFSAHAWLEADRQILIGGPASLVTQYTPFPDADRLTI